MKILSPVAFCLVSTVLATPVRADPPELAYEVTSASVIRAGAHAVTVCAKGTVPTGGYSRPTLTPARRAGHGGVYDLDLTAVRPEGIATQMVSPISATFTWNDPPADLKGVRVRGMNSAVVATLDQGGGC